MAFAQYHGDLGPALITYENVVDDCDFVKTYDDLLNSTNPGVSIT